MFSLLIYNFLSRFFMIKILDNEFIIMASN